MKKITQAARGSSPKAPQKKSGDTVSRKPVDQKLFKAAAAAKLREIDVIGENEDYLNHPALTQAIEVWENTTGKIVAEYDNAVVASAAFNDWIDENGYEYQAPVLYRIEEYTLTLSVPTKSGNVSLSASVTPLVDDHAAIIKALKKELTDVFSKSFPAPAQQNLPETGKTNGKTEYAIEEVQIEALRVSFYNGKVVYHAMPSEGNWTQYGIPLYGDIAKKFGIELPDEEGDYEVSWNVKYELKPDGKPRRVVEISE